MLLFMEKLVILMLGLLDPCSENLDAKIVSIDVGYLVLSPSMRAPPRAADRFVLDASNWNEAGLVRGLEEPGHGSHSVARPTCASKPSQSFGQRAPRRFVGRAEGATHHAVDAAIASRRSSCSLGSLDRLGR